jgi:hypothetical protein
MAEEFPNITVLETQFNDNDANKAAPRLQGVFAREPDLKGVSVRTCSRRWGLRMACSRPASPA